MISDLLDYRSNVQFYREDKIPPKEDIERILKTVHERMPHNNMRWHYNITIFGPESKEIKRKLAISSVCHEDSMYWRSHEPDEDEWGVIGEEYDKWRAFQRDPSQWTKSEYKDDMWHDDHGNIVPDTKLGVDDERILGFNEQVTAPWVLLYTEAKSTIHPSVEKEMKQIYKKHSDWGKDIAKGRVEKDSLYVQMGQHSTLTMLLALEAGYNVSYTKCLTLTPSLGFNRQEMQYPSFALSIGYPLEPRRSHSTNTMLPPWPQHGIPRPDIEDIVKWQ